MGSRNEDLDVYAPESMEQIAERRAKWLGLPVDEVMQQLMAQDIGVAESVPRRRFDRMPLGETTFVDLDKAA